MDAPTAFEEWWQKLRLPDGRITADHIRQAWDAGVTFNAHDADTENDRIDAAHRAIAGLWSDTMSWEQIETLARVVVRAIYVREQQKE